MLDGGTIKYMHWDTVLYPLGNRCLVEAAVTETLSVQVFFSRDVLELAYLLGSPPQATRVVGCHGDSYKSTCGSCKGTRW